MLPLTVAMYSEIATTLAAGFEALMGMSRVLG